MPVQEPFEQLSFSVHALLSLQVPEFFGVCTHPVAGLQLSSVQALLSSQLSGVVPGLQVPFSQTSPVVQAFPSLQAVEFGVKTQSPVIGSQESVVQGLLSLQVFGVPAHTPLVQISLIVQGFPSSHAALLKTWVQPVNGLQEAVVQTLLSSGQVTCVPVQVPFEQLSFSVHALLSLQVPEFFGVCTHPVAGLQLSSVQALLSSQLSGVVPGLQVPFSQTSPVVQAFPSLQAAEFGVKTQSPVIGSQESVVQGLLSLQVFGVPAHTPLEQTSLIVQGFPSSHAALLKTWVQPVRGLQEAVVQILLSSGQVTGVPVQVPFEQLSFIVHALLSLQVPEFFGVCTHPVAGLQLSSVQALLSSQLSGVVPGLQVPFSQTSPVVQAFPSLQAAEFGVKTQFPVIGSQ